MLIAERVSIRGEAGQLAGELSYPAQGTPGYLALLLNPHPHMGGSMENKLIAHLAAGLAGVGGAVAVRFDYRGVGGFDGPTADVAASMAEFWRTGRAPEDDGMLVDARAALRWALSQAPQLPVMLIGYSFGAAAAVQLLSDGDDDDDDDDDDNKNIAAAVLIAPTLCQHDFSPAARPRTPPLLVIYSDNDFATPRTFTEKWLATVDAASRCIAGGDHFFRDREGDVCDVCAAFARSALRRSEATCR